MECRLGIAAAGRDILGRHACLGQEGEDFTRVRLPLTCVALPFTQRAFEHLASQSTLIGSKTYLSLQGLVECNLSIYLQMQAVSSWYNMFGARSVDIHFQVFRPFQDTSSISKPCTEAFRQNKEKWAG